MEKNFQNLNTCDDNKYIFNNNEYISLVDSKENLKIYSKWYKIFNYKYNKLYLLFSRNKKKKYNKL
jgi:hypothetical protein